MQVAEYAPTRRPRHVRSAGGKAGRQPERRVGVERMGRGAGPVGAARVRVRGWGMHACTLAARGGCGQGERRPGQALPRAHSPAGPPRRPAPPSAAQQPARQAPTWWKSEANMRPTRCPSRVSKLFSTSSGRWLDARPWPCAAWVQQRRGSALRHGQHADRRAALRVQRGARRAVEAAAAAPRGHLDNGWTSSALHLARPHTAP